MMIPMDAMMIGGSAMMQERSVNDFKMRACALGP
jgi:hypothetical protein